MQSFSDVSSYSRSKSVLHDYLVGSFLVTFPYGQQYTAEATQSSGVTRPQSQKKGWELAQLTWTYGTFPERFKFQFTILLHFSVQWARCPERTSECTIYKAFLILILRDDKSHRGYRFRQVGLGTNWIEFRPYLFRISFLLLYPWH